MEPYLIRCVAVVVMVVSAAGGQVLAQEPTLSIVPDTFVSGKTYNVALQFSPCAEGNDPAKGHDLTKAKVFAAGTGITFAPLQDAQSKCSWAGTATLSADAATGVVDVVAQEATGASRVKIKVAAKAAGPIPPGLKPTVDVAWAVLPRRIASDNFGSRVTKLYYPVEVVIGNNSGYDLQVASVQFKLPDSTLQMNVPSDSYYVVRASLEREQLIGARNTTINIIRAIGPILTGSTVFFSGSTFAALHRKSVFEGITNIFSNPFEKGLELAIPDQTVQQLIRLDNHTLRDGTIIANNTQVRTMVFVNKDLLVHTAQNGSGNRAVEAKRLGGGGGAFSKHEYDQQAVMKALGSLELVGRPIVYLNRVSVISNPSGVAPQFTISPATVQQDSSNTSVQLTLRGDGMATGTLSTSSPQLVLTNPAASEGGKTYTATLDISQAVPGDYTITFTSPAGAQSARFAITPAPVVVDPVPAEVSVAISGSTPLSLTGHYLKNAKSLVTTDCGVQIFLDDTSDDTKRTGTITAPSSATATDNCTATVSDTTGGSQTFSFAVHR